jgi:hypothetical protein
LWFKFVQYSEIESLCAINKNTHILLKNQQSQVCLFYCVSLSLRGTKQSVGMMKEHLKTSARKLKDCFVPRNDKAHQYPKKIPTFSLKTNKAKFAYFV